MNELIRVLACPKLKLERAEIDAVLAAYAPFTESVTAGRPDEETALPECDDPDDQELLRLALAGHAEALVTGDGDLLRLRDQAPFPILTPAELKLRIP
jgi:putative PIN family toxin of toxin-antitoxin system